MARTFGRTRSEMQADSIGCRLAGALEALEKYQGDPEMVLDAAALRAKSAGAKDAVEALQNHYKGNLS